MFFGDQKKLSYFHNLLPWAFLVAPGIVQCKDGSYLTTIAYRGPDLDSSTKSELVAMSAQINNALKRLSDGWATYAESRRVKAKPYQVGKWPNKIAMFCDEERKNQFDKLDQYFESQFFLTFQYLPPSDRKKKFEHLLIEDDDEDSAIHPKTYLDYFKAQVNKVIDLLGYVWPRINNLDDNELLTYLHSTISTKDHPIQSPENPFNLDAILSDCKLVSGLMPILIGSDGNYFIQPIGIIGYPNSAIPAMFAGIDKLGISYRCITRFIYLDKYTAERTIKRHMKLWFSSQKSAWISFKERLLDMQSQITDDDALDKGEDAKLAMQLMKKDQAMYGHYTFTLILLDKDKIALANKARAVENVINGLGFTSIAETTNATEAFLGSIPGNATANVKKPVLNTLSLSRLMPTSAIWAGPERNEHLKAEPLFQAETDGNTPFRFSTHIGDVGHAMLVGPTGAGKSTFLSFAAMSFLRYEKARVVFFDVKRGSRATTLLMDGRFYELTTDKKSLRLQPLADIDNLAERAWATEWIEGLLLQENLQITPRIKSEIWDTLNNLASSQRAHRTITGFILTVQNNEVKQALAPYAEGGAYGDIFDGSDEAIGRSHWLSFEMGEIMGSRNAVRPALGYLFHKLETWLDGNPTLVVADETWLMLDSEEFSEKIRSWLKTFRSKNASFMFATQSLDDAAKSRIFATINDNVLTRIFLPNSKAMDENTAKAYRMFGLNETQLHILAKAIPKRDYYLASERGNRLFQLGLGPLVRTVVGSSSTYDQQLITQIEKSEDYFPSAFLDAYGHHDIADKLQRPVCLKKSA